MISAWVYALHPYIWPPRPCQEGGGRILAQGIPQSDGSDSHPDDNVITVFIITRLYSIYCKQMLVKRGMQ